MYLYESTKPSISQREYTDVTVEGFDYLAETDRTASGMANFSVTPVSELAADLRIFMAAAAKLNKHKKVLFRGQTRFEAGFPPWTDMDPAMPVTSVGERFPIEHADLLHGIIGVATESGELCEIAYNQLIHSARFDLTNVREEIGDVLWYLSRLVKWAETSFLVEMRRNINKLRERHGSSFSKSRDMQRDLSAERQVLDGES